MESDKKSVIEQHEKEKLQKVMHWIITHRRAWAQLCGVAELSLDDGPALLEELMNQEFDELTLLLISQLAYREPELWLQLMTDFEPPSDT